MIQILAIMATLIWLFKIILRNERTCRETANSSLAVHNRFRFTQTKA